MEVHHHAHSSTGSGHRKKWTHYIWEFLMLFLAVFCGFLAEYQLEHKIEKDREKQYVKSLVEDLQQDTSNLLNSLEYFRSQENYFDTVLTLFPQLSKGYNHSLHNSMIGLMGWRDFIPTDKTMEQLKYAGGMRLIRKRKVADAIAGYDALLRKYQVDLQELNNAFDKVDDKLGQIVNFEARERALRSTTIDEMEKGKENYLLKSDLPTLGEYYNRLWVYRFLRGLTADNLKRLHTASSDLIALLNNAYHLK
jgi:hypothetical protein